MSDDDYPDEDTIAQIQHWSHQDLSGLLDYVADQWHWPDFGVSRELRHEEAAVVHAESDDRFLRLATGGWSGNEELISALNSNLMARVLCWRLTARGGLHIYQYPEPVRSDRS